MTVLIHVVVVVSGHAPVEVHVVIAMVAVKVVMAWVSVLLALEHVVIAAVLDAMAVLTHVEVAVLTHVEVAVLTAQVHVQTYIVELIHNDRQI